MIIIIIIIIIRSSSSSILYSLLIYYPMGQSHQIIFSPVDVIILVTFWSDIMRYS